MLIPIVLLVILVAVVVGAHSMRKKGSMSNAAYSNLVSIVSIAITIAALATLYVRLR